MKAMSDPPKPFKLFATHNARPPLSAIDDHGNNVLDLISKWIAVGPVISSSIGFEVMPTSTV